MELAALAVVRDALAELRAETCLCLGRPTKESLLPLGLESGVAEILVRNWPCNVHWSTSSDAGKEELEMQRQRLRRCCGAVGGGDVGSGSA